MKLFLPTIKENKKSSGFTLIELLVVIGILGILAAALLATIDPLEQFRKAQDSTKEQASSELIGAVGRYYASRQAYPWLAVAAGGDGCNGNTAPAALIANSAGFTTCITALVNNGELKSTFTSSSALASITVNYTAPTFTACYQPVSKAEQHNPNAIYTNIGGAGATCIANGGASICFWCAR